MDIVIFLLVSFGVVYVVVDSGFFAPIRLTLAARSVLLESFLYCAYCVGFWVGFGQALAWSGPDWAWTWADALRLCDAVSCGALVMGSVALIRAFAPNFLAGAWEREREGRELLQRRGDGAVDRDGEAGADDG